jgi:hypothetical protein
MENKGNKENLERLKRDYEILRAKYNLPSFHELNKDFWIDELSECETDILIRKIRAKMGDVLMNVVRFIENLLNPVNVPMFIFRFIKLINLEDKKVLSEIYEQLIKKEIKVMKMDFEFNEENEAEFIKETYETWQNMKGKLLNIIRKIDATWDNKSDEGKRDYFG